MFKDPELKKKYYKNYMARRRAEAKRQVEIPAPSGAGNLETAQHALIQATSPEKTNPSALVETSERELTPAAGPQRFPNAQAAMQAQNRQLASPNVSAIRVAELTEYWLEKRGWIIWECSKLNNDRVVIARDETVKGYPPGLVVFTDFELKKIADVPDATFRLIYEAKKNAGARLL